MTVSYLDREDRKDQGGRKFKEPKEEQGRTDLRNGDGEERGGERKMRGTERDRELSVPSSLSVFSGLLSLKVHGFHFQLVR